MRPAEPPPSTQAPAPPALYVNYFELGQNPFEFLIELGQYRPGATDSGGSIAIHTRIAMAPSYAKMLARLFERAVAEHELENGTIAAVDDNSATPFDIVLKSLPEFEERARAVRAAPPVRSSRNSR